MYYLQLFFYILVVSLFSIFVIVFIKSIINIIRYKVPQVWTFASDFKVMKKHLWKYDLSWKKLADLWSWTWKVLRFFEKEFAMKTTWYEIDFFNILVSRFLNSLLWYKSLTIKWDYLKTDLSGFDVVYVYGFTILMPGIEKKLWKNCKKDTLIISNAFKLPNKEPIEVLLDDKLKEEVYIYKI